MIARDIAHLHGDTLELARLGNNITKLTDLTEKGEIVPGLNDGLNPRSREYAYMLEQTVSNRHETLTGTQPDGRAYPPGKDYTCNNWTSEANGTSDNLRQNTGRQCPGRHVGPQRRRKRLVEFGARHGRLQPAEPRAHARHRHVLLLRAELARIRTGDRL